MDSNNSLITKNQMSVAPKEDTSNLGLDSLIANRKQSFDLEESVSDILKKFQEDQDKILKSNIAFTFSTCENELNNQDC